LAAAGLKADHADGENLAAIADGSCPREMVFGQYEDAHAAIHMAVSRDWKYIWSAPDQKELLFDRRKDPDELRNRAYNVACGTAVRTLREQLQNHIRALPGHEKIVDSTGWIAKEPIVLPDDPDAGLIVQDPPCFTEQIIIPGYSD
jgi:arylsulfatase A-like enzyme